MMICLLAASLLWNAQKPLEVQEGRVVIRVPRSWMAGREVSACTVRPSVVLALLGRPDVLTGSGWYVRWHYHRFGVWVEWERPVKVFSLAYGVPAAARAALRAWSPRAGGMFAWLLEARFLSRESLVGIGWSAWGMRAAWRGDGN